MDSNKVFLFPLRIHRVQICDLVVLAVIAMWSMNQLNDPVDVSFLNKKYLIMKAVLGELLVKYFKISEAFHLIQGSAKCEYPTQI